tara:strand:- start:416 stop:1315 length:900 start_codon:yes stop_codon:yes gene_type:complete
MYNKLLLKSIDFNKNNSSIDLQTIIGIMEGCYKNIGFSTFGYIFDNSNSYKSINQYNSANCIGMSIWVQQRLQKLNIISYLIPASIPKIYKMPKYLNISHVALFVPLKDNSYIIDCAFYFLSPIIVNLKMNKCISNIYSKKIYDVENHSDILEYNSISTINCELNKTNTDLKLNEYQIIPKNIYYCKCNYNNNLNDTWNYYLTNVINPDTAITSFFIKIKKNPFICCHKIDNNGIPICDYYIKFHDENISLKKNGITNIYEPNQFLNIISKDDDLYKKLEYHFSDNFTRFINTFYKNIN